jgi:hypothetical protein
MVIVSCAFLCGCATASQSPIFNTRQLTPAEKQMLRVSLARTLKDPDAAQFKWMPVVVPSLRSLPEDKIGYCGLVNGKNSYGGYVGFKRFFSLLDRNANNEYISGTIQHIEGAPITFGGTSTVDDAVETGLVEGSCKSWGYTDFNQAQ